MGVDKATAKYEPHCSRLMPYVKIMILWSLIVDSTVRHSRNESRAKKAKAGRKHISGYREKYSRGQWR